MEAISKFLKDHPTISTWGSLGLSILVAVVIVFILLKFEKKIAARMIKKFDGINARFTEKLIRFRRTGSWNSSLRRSKLRHKSVGVNSSSYSPFSLRLVSIRSLRRDWSCRLDFSIFFR